MGVLRIVIVVLATLLTTSSLVSTIMYSDERAILKTTSFNDEILARSHAGTIDDKRNLRISSSTEGIHTTNNEQRITLSNLPTGLVKLAETSSNYPITQKLTLTVLLKANTSPTEVFILLKLNQLQPMRLKNTSAKLKENQALLEWLKYTEAYAWPRAKILDRLTEIAPEKEVAIFLQGLKDVPNMKTIGHELQMTQFEQWRMMKMTSDDLAKGLGILKISESMGTQKSILFFEYELFLLKKLLPSTP